MRTPAVRYEHPVAGDLVHIDVKKIGRIPAGGGWRVHGKDTDAHRASQRQPRPGYAYLHSVVDDCSRPAYTEELPDEKGATAACFWHRAVQFYAAHGITIRRVLSDNGSCYRSAVFNEALGPWVKHHYTRPYRPQTNGKIERFHHTLAREWANRQAWDSNHHRSDGLAGFLHRYKLPSAARRTQRPQSVQRTATVTNLHGSSS